MSDQDLKALIASRRPGHGLPQAFYRDPAIYERDLARVFRDAWLYAGHVSELAASGDFRLVEVGRDPVILLRGEDGALRAFHNVCRHRGSRLVSQPCGNAQRLVCPYHAWAYGLDGSLQHARHMPADFDPAVHGLRPVALEELEGLLFINLAATPSDFAPVRAALSDALSRYGLADAKVACSRRYEIAANWKLAVENYTECYHCAPAHPEYSVAHSLARPGARDTEAMAEVMARAASCGLSEARLNRVYDTAEAQGADYAHERYPLLDGHLTGSEDGQPVAPLMGSLSGYDGGTTDLQVGPVSFGLAYPDHLVLYRFLPLSVDRCACDISWLVRGDAAEGRDYELERLTWLWDVTTRADQRIIEGNQAGVDSSAYQPGPLSEMEVFTDRFLGWYLATIA